MRQNIAIFIGIAALILTSSVVAQTSRDDKWEGTLQLFGTSAESSDGEMGSSIDVDSAVGLRYEFNNDMFIKGGYGSRGRVEPVECDNADLGQQGQWDP